MSRRGSSVPERSAAHGREQSSTPVDCHNIGTGASDKTAQTQDLIHDLENATQNMDRPTDT